jgi:predicted MFS family arabinose efflux permease
MRVSRPHYAYLVVALIFFALLAAAGLRSTPAVLLVPWANEFHWSRSVISFAAAVGIFLYGLTGPFAAAAMQRFGIRKTVLFALALMSVSSLASLWMTASWQLILLWGVISGIGSGCVASVLSATIVNRWFVTHRGLVMGLLAASTSTGTLIFFPTFSAIQEWGGWKPVVIVVAVCLGLLIPLVWWLLPEWPADVGQTPFGGTQQAAPVANKANPLKTAFGGLKEGLESRDFWLLAGTFFVCGFTTNGLIGTHMIALCGDHGLDAVVAGGLLAVMGAFDLVGTTASGWLTDRYDPRKLLFVYYGLRGLSLIYLPFADFSFRGLSLFAVFYGLDWIATVPPTLALTNRAFGSQKAPVIFGWILASHQLGAALAAFIAGYSRSVSGSYLEAFVAAGFIAIVAAFAALMIGRDRTVMAEMVA